MDLIGLNKKKNKKINLLITTIFFFVILIIFLPTLIINFKEKRLIENSGIDIKEGLYSYEDLNMVLVEEGIENSYNINLSDSIIYENKDNINIKIEKFDSNNDYELEIKINNELTEKIKINEKNMSKEINIKSEGKNNININLYENNELKKNYNEDIYYIIPYKKQFLDEFSNKGTQVHYKYENKMENPDESIKLIKDAGIKNIRLELLYSETIKKYGNRRIYIPQ